MVRHSYSEPRYIKWFFSFSITLWIYEKNVNIQRKTRHYCFSFGWLQVFFQFQYPFSFELSIILPFLVKLEVLGPPCGGRSHGWVRYCLPFQNENRVFARLFLQGGLGLLMGSRVGYRVCECFPYRRTLIVVPFTWIIQIVGPPQGTSSFWYPRKVIICLSHFESCTSLHKGGG